MQKLVSIVMSMYNEPMSMIKESIDSVLNQSYPNIEVVLIRDNPARIDIDAYVESLLTDFPNIVYIKNPTNMGLVKSLNNGICHANGDYIARMDADDISHRRRIELQVEYLERNNCDFIGCEVEKINEEKNIVGEIIVPSEHDDIVKFNRYGNCLLHPTWLLKAIVYKELNGYRDVMACEDYDFVIRAISRGFVLGNAKMKLLKYRIRCAGISVSQEVTQRLIRYYISDCYYTEEAVPNVSDIGRYLASAEFESRHAEMERYVNKKNIIRESNNFLYKGMQLLSCIPNKYFYVGLLHRLKQIERAFL